MENAAVPPRATRSSELRLIGLPDQVVPTVHASSRVGMTCPRKWWFSKVERLDGPAGRALSWGTAWHHVLEDIHAWWYVTGGKPYPMTGLQHCVWCAGREPDAATCWHCSGTSWGPVRHLVELWVGTHMEEDAEAFKRAAEGWLWRWGTTPPHGKRVVAVELGLGMPIVGASGGVFAPELPWVTRNGVDQLAGTGEGELEEVRWERRPWYVACRLDVLWEDTELGCYEVGEFKSSTNPRQWLEGLSVDPQVTIYQMVTQWVISQGLIPGADSKRRVSGWLLDISSSKKQQDPKVLGSGELSKDKKALSSVPSWRLIPALTERGLMANEFWQNQREIQRAKVDAELYEREPGASPPDWIRRAQREMLGEARRASALHRSAAMASGLDDPELDYHFPRVPICRVPGGYCPFRGPCQQDGGYAREGLRRSHHLPESRGFPSSGGR